MRIKVKYKKKTHHMINNKKQKKIYNKMCNQSQIIKMNKKLQIKLNKNMKNNKISRRN